MFNFFGGCNEGGSGSTLLWFLILILLLFCNSNGCGDNGCCQ